MSEKYQPYVISADTNGLMKNWARKNQLSLPNDSYFDGQLAELGQVLQTSFPDVEIIPEAILRWGLNELVRSSALPVISLDRSYVDPAQPNLAGFLDVTRTVDANLNNAGLGGRAQEISIEKQLNRIAQKYSGQPIALIDDVIFEGNTILQLVQSLRNKGVAVDRVFAGITIKAGQDLLEQNGVRVQSVVTYDQVTDEICERDFKVGAPYSGRTVVTDQGVAGAPYIYPFGKPIEWASIPEDQATEFSWFCLAQSLQLWLKIENLSRQSVSTDQLDKPVFGLSPDSSVATAIKKTMIQMKDS